MANIVLQTKSLFLSALILLWLRSNYIAQIQILLQMYVLLFFNSSLLLWLLIRERYSLLIIGKFFSSSRFSTCFSFNHIILSISTIVSTPFLLHVFLFISTVYIISYEPTFSAFYISSFMSLYYLNSLFTEKINHR